MTSKKKWIIGTVAALIITNGLTFYASSKLSFVLPNGKAIGGEQYSDISKFEKMFMVRNQLYKYYDGKIDDNALVEGAIKGMTSALQDPYTVFMNKKEFDSFNTQTEGTYTGLGLQVGVKDNKIVVIAPFEDSPAKKAGILAGDVIDKVNGVDVTGQDLEKAVGMMKGEKGTSVSLTLTRDGKGDFDVKVNREQIEMVTVTGEMLQNNIGYIRISMFDENTAKNFNKKLKELQGKGMKGLVLDLRGNPGGLLNECVDVVSNFIPKGKTIVSTIDKYKNEKKYDSKGGAAINLPLVVLTDEGTASASEIVSGAVRDYKLGTLIGKKTFGKGVVQTILDTGNGTALKVTISKYYTPNGENIHGTGIKPDIEVELPKSVAEKYDRSLDPQFNKAIEVIKDKMK
ncbi:S41 family peptidase [Clostridium omnivorum]|uniref:Peptidase S41 n=1 Tax=Clostridium omnivorum TaxID=1604902 RepID=A0ABQ5N369_9CLOT|nr:S41 family peptidase [Clostridium sp. E14]GLC29662.1 peptidase S41 [Clostridium sp. E14]